MLGVDWQEQQLMTCLPWRGVLLAEAIGHDALSQDGDAHSEQFLRRFVAE